LTINELPTIAHRGIRTRALGTRRAVGGKGLVALTYSQGYKRLLNGQSIKSISSPCPLRDPGGVCFCHERRHQKGRECAPFFVNGECEKPNMGSICCLGKVLFNVSEAEFLYFMATAKRCIYQKSCFPPALTESTSILSEDETTSAL